MYRTQPKQGKSELLIMTPVEFLRRWTLPMPPPNKNLVHYYGALAPRSPLRPALVAEAGKEVRRLSDNTQRVYLHAVFALARRYMKSPDQFSDRQIQDYVLYMLNERKPAWSTCDTNIAWLQFFYGAAFYYERPDVMICGPLAAAAPCCQPGAAVRLPACQQLRTPF